MIYSFNGRIGSSIPIKAITAAPIKIHCIELPAATNDNVRKTIIVPKQ
ncbi:hypothetical protein ABWW58_10840 [Sporolactobacillus sp. STCC-11]